MARRTVIIAQARMGSSRLPGKVLKDLAGKPILERLLERLLRVRGVDQVLVATSDASADDPVANVATRMGIAVFRGSEDDVLD